MCSLVSSYNKLFEITILTVDIQFEKLREFLVAKGTGFFSWLKSGSQLLCICNCIMIS